MMYQQPRTDCARRVLPPRLYSQELSWPKGCVTAARILSAALVCLQGCGVATPDPEIASTSGSGIRVEADQPSDGDPECAANSDCDDALFCNGSEQCNEGVCAQGVPPCDGADCEEAVGECFVIRLEQLEGVWELKGTTSETIACLEIDRSGRILDWRYGCEGPNRKWTPAGVDSSGKESPDKLMISASLSTGIVEGSGFATIHLSPVGSEEWEGVLTIVGVDLQTTERSVTLLRSDQSLDEIPVSRVEQACRFVDQREYEANLRAYMNRVPYSAAVQVALDVTAEDDPREPLVGTFRGCWLAVTDDVYGVD